MSREHNIKNQQPHLKQLKHLILDLDGTIYKGETLFPFVLEFFDIIQNLGIGYTFITNNSAFSVRQYLQKLNTLGLPATVDTIYTSALMTIDYLQSRMKGIKRLFIVGTDGLKSEFRDENFEIVASPETQRPDAVVVGFDPNLDFTALCKAGYWIQRDVPFIATNPDRICPTDQKTLLIDCGSLCAALETATGKSPDAVLGKPDPRMIQGVINRKHLENGDVAVIGDRLYTDMEMAKRADVLSVLVLTGETQPDDISDCSVQPDIVVDNVLEFAKILQKYR